MRSLWLPLLSFATVTAIVFGFFAMRILPVKTPELDTVSGEDVRTTPTVTFVDPVRGAANPKVTIVAFSDFQCQACKEIDTSIEAVLRTFPNDVRQVWKDMPNESVHPLSTLAGIAAHCAQEQGAFWEYHDRLYERQTYLAEEHFAQIAGELGLNQTAFARCYDNRQTLGVVKNGYDEGKALGIVSTPTIYINDTSYVGALTVEQLTSYVQRALANP